MTPPQCKHQAASGSGSYDEYDSLDKTTAQCTKMSKLYNGFKMFCTKFANQILIKPLKHQKLMQKSTFICI